MTDPVRTEEREQRPQPLREIVVRGIGWTQQGVYVAVGVMLAVAAVLVLAGTISGLIDGVNDGDSAVLTGLLVLDRILLLLIIAELLHTLRFVVGHGEIYAEPFLLIGLIAVVRRVVIVTANVEQLPYGTRLEDFLLELGVLAALALAFAVAIYMLRRSASQAEPPPIHSPD